MSVVLNEVYYDPSGADGGYEFVEIALSAGQSAPVSLLGWRLETGNGATPGVWRLAWEGGPADTVGVDPFVLGESGVEPRPHVVVDLDLQNGPDGCRLVAPNGATDVLGWGEDLSPVLYEGTPAPDVASGRSLARRPDGRDTGDNFRDFAAGEPSPGAFNSPALEWVVLQAEWPPAGLEAGAPWQFRWTVRNTGRGDWTQALRVECGIHPGELLVAVALSTPLGSGAERELEAVVSPPSGIHWPRCDPECAPAPAAWWGLGAELVLNEVMAAPRDGGPEWVEIQAVGERPVDLVLFQLQDAAGSHTSLWGTVEPRGFVVVTPDTSAFRARWPSVDSPLAELSPWPVLNQTASAGQIAERLSLLLGDREASVAVVPGAGEFGVSWERIARALPGDQVNTWRPSLDGRGGTPGRENSQAGDRPVLSVRGSIAVHPSPYRPGQDGAALIVVDTGVPRARCTVDVWDSAGRSVATLRSWPANSSEHRALWDGRDSEGDPVPLGLYLIRADHGAGTAQRQPLVVVR